MNEIFFASLPYAFWAIIYHLIADWMLQSEWMAINKSSLTHPAAWVHGAIHLAFMLVIFPWQIAIIIALLHIVIDERSFMRWWRKKYGQTTEGEMGVHVAIWTDQVAHIVIICIASQYFVWLMQQKLI